MKKCTKKFFVIFFFRFQKNDFFARRTRRRARRDFAICGRRAAQRCFWTFFSRDFFCQFSRRVFFWIFLGIGAKPAAISFFRDRIFGRVYDFFDFCRRKCSPFGNRQNARRGRVFFDDDFGGIFRIFRREIFGKNDFWKMIFCEKRKNLVK